MSTAQGSGGRPNAEYLTDLQARFVHATQGWGLLGIDVAAHAKDQQPAKLRIKDKEYSKGLGHHAPGEIIVDLDGAYDTFEAEVGVQWQGGNVGSVVFQVFVDDEKRFDTGVMREGDPAKPVRVSVVGALDLRLVVTDAGDGITCDCADWADARLTRSALPPSRPPAPTVDVAQFGRVVTSDPARSDGARSSRIQGFRAEDVFLETDLAPDSAGIYAVPSYDGVGCIGIQWIEQRRLKEIGIEFADRTPADGVQAQCWVGQSLWQGEWKPLAGRIETEGSRWTIHIDRAANPDIRTGARKIRWILPKAADRTVIKRLWAFTDSRWDDVDLAVELEKPIPGRLGEIEVYNGAVVSRDGTAACRSWDLSEPLRMRVRYSRPRPWKSDRTVVRFRLPSGSFGVAVDDLIANRCVYVKDAGVFVALESAKIKLADYLRGIRGRKTILQRVREMPDQTLAQSLAKTRNPIQSTGPTILSLACDNRKIVVTREGAIQFPTDPERSEEGFAYRPANLGQIVPRFGSGRNEGLSRHLEGGWLPVPVIKVCDGGIDYTQRTCVVPSLKEQPLCVAEFEIENRGTRPADASLRLDFQPGSQQEPKTPKLTEKPYGVSIEEDGRLLAWFLRPDAGPLRCAVENGALVLSGMVPPNSRTVWRLLVPGWEVAPDDRDRPPDAADPAARVGSYWDQVLAPAMQVQLPDEFLTNLIRASQVYCLLAARNENGGARIAPWIASVVYGPLESEANSIILGMSLMGHEEFARRSLEYYIHRYSPQGFLTTGYTLMGTGWHLWSLGEFYKLYRDEAWMKRVAPEVARVCEWIAAQREKTKKLDARGDKVPEYGLVPPGVLADWGAFAYHYCLEGYYYAGLKRAAEALADIGTPGADSLLRNAEEFRREILRAYEWTQGRMPVVELRDGTWIPGYPAQVYTLGPTEHYFPGEDANRSWAYDVELGAHQLVPQGVLDPASREVERMMDHMEDVQFLRAGWGDYPAARSEADWFNLGGFAKMQPYYCRNAEICALRDDVKPFIRSYFNTLASLVNTETMWFWEHFHAGGAWNKTHETGYFLQQTRLMLVMERGDELWLAPFVTSNWMKEGMRVAVRNAPTRFGPVAYRITSHVNHGGIEAEIFPPTRTAPREIVIRLRHPEGRPIKSVTVNGESHADFDADKEVVRVKPGPGKIDIVARF